MGGVIQRRRGLPVTPSFPQGAASIEIVDPQNRKKALLALMEQERIDRKTAIDSALEAKTLAPIIDAAPTLINLYSLEFTATSAAEEIRPTLMKEGERARQLIGQELVVTDQRVSQIETDANQR